MTRWDRVAVGTGLAGVLLPALLLVGVPQPARALVAFALLAFVPGFAVTRLIDLASLAFDVVVAIAVSLALATAVSTGLLYLTAWSWGACVCVLGALTVAASVVRLGRTS
jgi:uncharacterized membrane protein